MDSKKSKSKNSFLPPKIICTNQNYSLGINDFGDLYSWGSNKEGRLGHKLEQGELLENAKKYEFFTNQYMKVIEVSCGLSHIAIVASNKSDSSQEVGQVYTWGLSLYGRLGYIEDQIDDKIRHAKNEDDSEMWTYKMIPKALNIPDKVTRISCGTDFSGCITVRGQLFTWEQTDGVI